MRRPSLALVAVVCAFLLVSGVHCSSAGGSSSGDGTIEVSGSGVTIKLTGPKSVTVMSGQKVAVPAGTYKATGIEVVANQQYGGRSIPWRIENDGSLGELTQIRVRGGKTTTIKAGPPFTVRANVDVTGGSGKTIDIEMEIVGASGELYSHEIWRGQQCVPAPRCRVVDRSGNILTQGTLSYG